MSQFSIAGMQLELKNKNNMPFILDQIRATKERFPWLDMIVLTELCGLGVKQQYAQPMPSEVNFELVRRTRENGILKLGQPLKSLRQHAGKALPNLDYQSDYLQQLGHLPCRICLVCVRSLTEPGNTRLSVVLPQKWV